MDESESDAPEVQQETVRVGGRVKWFNAVKGYGFVTTESGSDDVFLHHSALRNAGFDGIEQGATVECEAVRGPKGLQALRVLSVDMSTAEPDRNKSPGAEDDGHPVVEAEGEFFDATAKWFNAEKGYGFVTRGEGTPDVFVHVKALRRVGIDDLVPGQPLRVRVGNGPKGPQVAEIQLV